MPDAGTGTLLSAGASILGGAISGEGAQSAADTQAASGAASIAEQRREFDIGQKNLQPYMDVGKGALYTLADYLGLSGVNDPSKVGSPSRPVSAADAQSDQFKQVTNDIYAPYGGFNSAQFLALPQEQQTALNTQATQKFNAAQAAANPNAGQTSNTGTLLKPFSFDISQDPGYQFRLDQGNQAVQNSAAARGTQLSGATLKELLKYGSDYASGEYNAAFNRDLATKNQTFSELAGVAGMGQGATNTGIQAGNTSAANIGNTLTGIGNAQAAGQVGVANAISGGFSNAASGYNQQQLLNSILNRNPGVASVNAGANLGGLGTEIGVP